MNYIDEYRVLHADRPDYGATSIIHLQEICLFIDELKPSAVLDFGCGKAALIKELVEIYPKIEFYGYDPAVSGREVLPIEKADLVICCDVLEHIPEEEIPDIIHSISKISSYVFFNLHHGLAVEILPGGSNAHCTVKPPQWYHNIISQYFDTLTPLTGRFPNTTAAATFNLSPQVFFSYDRIIREDYFILKDRIVWLENMVEQMEVKLERFIELETRIVDMEKLRVGLEQLVEKECLLTDTGKELSERAAHISELEQSLLIVLNSRSWRITKPLRYVVKILRRIFFC
jgi:hypothetical protein